MRFYADLNNKVQINDVNLKFIFVHYNDIMFCFHTTQHDLPNDCNFEEFKFDSDYRKHT